MVRQKKQPKFPILRVMLTVLLATVLFSAAFYAYFKQMKAKGVGLNEIASSWQHWMVQSKKNIHTSWQTDSEQSFDDTPVEEQVNFEFYHSLADSRMEVDENTKSEPVLPVKSGQRMQTTHQAQAAPRKSLPTKLTLAKPVITATDLEHEFYRQNLKKRKSS